MDTFGSLWSLRKPGWLWVLHCKKHTTQRCPKRSCNARSCANTGQPDENEQAVCISKLHSAGSNASQDSHHGNVYIHCFYVAANWGCKLQANKLTRFLGLPLNYCILVCIYLRARVQSRAWKPSSEEMRTVAKDSEPNQHRWTELKHSEG